ncbi:amastin-like surface protein, putative [Leishmania tarentolae]|uniref:Amastin-like surface protein, putative n=1 Tax=Leishmania tarentolae TaxID=5689 RepID=A0A640KSA2_LEITA|nr:amastin-like surface protein, putative [Leishmania tarentolae]
MEWSIGMIIYTILQFIAFLLVLVGTPIDMFRSNEKLLVPANPCLTLFGFKMDCSSTNYFGTSDEMWASCTGRRDRFRAAQVFAIISIVVYGAAFVLGLLTLCRRPRLRWVCLALSIAGIVTLCIVWACMAVTYNKDEGENCAAANDFMKFGAGLVLLLVAWCLDIINIVFLLLPCEV